MRRLLRGSESGIPTSARVCSWIAALVATASAPALAQQKEPDTVAPPKKAAPAPGAPVPAPPAAPPIKVGLPQDAGPHDAISTIEWWYFNSFFTTESGGKYSLIGSFFRTGLPGGKKGHYLIYSLMDMVTNKRTSYSTIDKTEIEILKAFLQLDAARRPDDPRPLRLFAQLQRGELPEPHRPYGANALVRSKPQFSIAFGPNMMSQESEDARTWKATLNGEGDDSWTADLTLTQPETERPAMLVGGEGKTGLKRPDDMFYVSLTRMGVTGTFTTEGVVEKIKGTGWLDRQWGRSWIVEDNGWDWFGVQLDDGSDLIVYRLRDNKTRKILRAEATLLTKEGQQIVDKALKMRPIGTWTDPDTDITFPAGFEVTLPATGLTLNVTPTIPEQTIPVLGIGTAIWEGVVNVTGTNKEGTPVTGQGYMELVGYQPKKATPTTTPKTTTGKKAVR
jgi:predicted secreted hydrolase